MTTGLILFAIAVLFTTIIYGVLFISIRNDMDKLERRIKELEDETYRL